MLSIISILLSIIGRVVINDANELHSRIVGGTDVPVDSYPWFVKFDGCGGFLISPEFVLTAGK